MGRFGSMVLGAMTLSVSMASAGEWRKMAGPEIASTLTDWIVDYRVDTWQDFRASGRTLYHAGRPSWGHWAVRGDQYCSSWPPSDLWSCYDMERGSGDKVRWIGVAGDITPGTLRGRID